MICTKYKAEAPWSIDPSRFPWPEGRLGKEVTRLGQHTLYKGTRPVQVILRFLFGLGRSWPDLAGITFLTEVGLQPK